MRMAPNKTAPIKTRRLQPKTGTRKGLQSQNKTVRSISIRPAPIFQMAHGKRKRSRDSEAKAKCSAKHPRRSRSPRLEPFEEDLQKDSEAKADDLKPLSLSEESEKDIRTLYKEVINSVAHSASTLERTSSWRSMVTSKTDTVRSQHFLNTSAHYCYKHLKDAKVYIHINPPKDIQAAINAIINAKPSEDCHAILRDKAKKFSKRCKEMVRAAAGKNDFVHLFYNFIEDISPDNLISREKADWRIELKPAIQQSDANLSFLLNFDAVGSDKPEEFEDTSTLLSPKRHQ